MKEHEEKKAEVCSACFHIYNHLEQNYYNTNMKQKVEITNEDKL